MSLQGRNKDTGAILKEFNAAESGSSPNEGGLVAGKVSEILAASATVHWGVLMGNNPGLHPWDVENARAGNNRCIPHAVESGSAFWRIAYSMVPQRSHVAPTVARNGPTLLIAKWRD
jgi:hypothetical protein